VTWLPSDHRLGVHQLDELGQIDPNRPMADIDVVSLALRGPYTLIRTAASDRHGMVSGLRASPLASKLAMDLTSDQLGGVPALGFRRGDMSWVSLLPDLPSVTERVVLTPAHPEDWLVTNWAAAALALTNRFVLAPTSRPTADQPVRRWSVMSSPGPPSTSVPSTAILRRTVSRPLGDLTWAVRYVTPSIADADDPEDDAFTQPELPRCRVSGVPWWDIGAWLLSRRPPRL
jgi:hypothetical protein